MQRLHRNVASDAEIEDARRDLFRCRVLLPIQTDGHATSAIMKLVGGLREVRFERAGESRWRLG
jgi:hypothetical protein